MTGTCSQLLKFSYPKLERRASIEGHDLYRPDLRGSTGGSGTKVHPLEQVVAFLWNVQLRALNIGLLTGEVR